MMRLAFSVQRSAVRGGRAFLPATALRGIQADWKVRAPFSDFRSHAFTLIELLAVIGIIVLLAGIIVGTASFANRRALQSRTQGQLHELTLALEMYKNTVGYYPTSPTDWPKTNVISHSYLAFQTNNNLALYRALTNRNSEGSVYYEFKPEQLQNILVVVGPLTNSSTAMVDPYGNLWGYLNYSGSQNQFNGRSYDLWSYGINPAEPTNSLIANWRQQ